MKQYPNIEREIDANIHDVLVSGQYVMGSMLRRFEQELADYRRMKYAVCIGNGTDALWPTFMALGIGPGDECITTTNTFFATAEAIRIGNATAVFVDSDANTNCIDLSLIEDAITPKTRALVPVHLYRQCADIKAIRKIADKHNLLVIEDHAQSIGARGDGGAVITNNETVDRMIRKLRNHGLDKMMPHHGVQQPSR